MNWATFFKDYGVLVTAGAGLIGIFLTFIFTRSHYIRSRKWDLEDREFNRRLEIQGIRIKEAREYVDTIHDLLHSRNNLIGILLFRDMTNEGNRAELYKVLDHINNLHDIAGKQTFSISVLDDDLLTELHVTVSSIALSQTESLSKSMNAILRKEGTEGDKKLLEILSHTYSVGESVIPALKRRLDELSQSLD